MHTLHWLRNARLSVSEINNLLTTCKSPALSPELTNLYVNTYSTDKYYIEYNGFLSNHIAHGMIALWKLNCNTSVIHNFMKWYDITKHLETPSVYEQKNDYVSLKPIKYEWNNVDAWIGSRTNFYGIYNMMKHDFETADGFNNNMDRLIADRFPSFSNGISGSLLHGLIHLGYGVSCMNKQMILEGMAYTTHSYLQFDYKPPSNTTHHGNMDILSVLDIIRKDGTLKKCIYDNYHHIEHIELGLGQQPFICLSEYGQDIISEYMSMFINTIPLMTVNNDENRNIYLNQLYKLKKYILSVMITLYAYGSGLDYNDFVLLHGVTAAWSLSQILPYLNNIEEMNQSLLQFISVCVATFCVQFEPDIQMGINEAKLKYDDCENNWRYLMAEIVYNLKKDASKDIFYDEHVYKVVAVILECLEYDFIDEELAYYAVRKAAEIPLKIRTIGHARRDWMENISRN